MSLNEIFLLDIPVVEALLRASITYLGMCILLRAIPKRHTGNMSPNDIAGMVIIGGLVVAGISRDMMSIPGVFLMMAVVLLWNYLIDWSADRFPPLRPYLREAPTLLIKDGVLIPRNLRREMIVEDELRAELRKHDIEDFKDVREAFIENDGTISIVTKEEKR